MQELTYPADLLTIKCKFNCSMVKPFIDQWLAILKVVKNGNQGADISGIKPYFFYTAYKACELDFPCNGNVNTNKWFILFIIFTPKIKFADLRW